MLTLGEKLFIADQVIVFTKKMFEVEGPLAQHWNELDRDGEHEKCDRLTAEARNFCHHLRAHVRQAIERGRL